MNLGSRPQVVAARARGQSGLLEHLCQLASQTTLCELWP